jgi:hypothetical protein
MLCLTEAQAGGFAATAAATAGLTHRVDIEPQRQSQRARQ